MKVTASKLHRVMACGQSDALERAAPLSDKTDAAREGDAAHWAFQTALECGDMPVGEVSPDGYVITPRMAEHLSWPIDVIRERNIVDERIEYDASWHDGAAHDSPGVKCRGDYFAYDCDTDTLYVDELKYGHRIVEVEENWQLIAAAIGWCVIQECWAKNIVLTVHQPRPHHPDGQSRSWSITSEDLEGYMHAILDRLRNLPDELATGEHCRYCRAAAHCPALREATYNAIDTVLSGTYEDLPGDALRRELDLLKKADDVLSIRKSAIEDDAIARIKTDPVAVPGYGLEEKYGNRAFDKRFSNETLEMLLGVSVTEPKRITPAAAVRAKANAEVVDSLSTRPFIGLKLKPVNIDKKAKGLFNNG